MYNSHGRCTALTIWLMARPITSPRCSRGQKDARCHTLCLAFGHPSLQHRSYVQFILKWMWNPFSRKKEMSAIHTPYFSIKTLTNIDIYFHLNVLSPMLIHWGSNWLERADCISYPVIPILLPGPCGLVWKRDFLKNNTQITCLSHAFTWQNQHNHISKTTPSLTFALAISNH